MTTVVRMDYNGKDLCVDAYEVLRYLGYKRDCIKDEDIASVNDKVEDLRQYFQPKCIYGRFDVTVNEDGHIVMPYGSVFSKNLATNLSGCREIFIFAATLGPRFDMNLNRMRVVSVSEAAVIQAIGAAACEGFCNEINRRLAKEVSCNHEKLRPRYSPGFGDYTLENQVGVFKVLSPEKNIGLTLRDTLIMSPEKSVTAVIGIESED